jgi:catechol 2,3-dioxygenase-like lactoylglutathione lyase family enzyme
MGAASLDHVGVAGRDLGPLAAAWERLGFRLTPMARHSGRRAPGAPVEPFATGNRCIMLREGYIELIAIVAPGAFDNLVGPALDRYAGIHIVALGVEDEAAEMERLRRAGFGIPGVAHLERPVDDADPDGPRARFARLPLPDAPEGRIMLIRHLTPEAIWQARFLDHPNRAVALEEVVLAVADPAEAAARFSRLAGRPVVPDPVGGYALPLPQGRVRLLPPDALGAVFPGVAAPTLPFVAGIVVRTEDRGAAVRGILQEAGIADGPFAPPSETGGAALAFR